MSKPWVFVVGMALGWFLADISRPLIVDATVAAPTKTIDEDQIGLCNEPLDHDQHLRCVMPIGHGGPHALESGTAF